MNQYSRERIAQNIKKYRIPYILTLSAKGLVFTISL